MNREPAVRTAVTLLSLAVLAGCLHSDPPVEPHRDVSGRYVLQTVDGLSLPVYWSAAEQGHNDLVSAVLVLEADGSCRLLSRYRFQRAHGALEYGGSSGCTYRVDGVAFSAEFPLPAEGARSATGTIEHAGLHLRQDQRSMVYRRDEAGGSGGGT